MIRPVLESWRRSSPLLRAEVLLTSWECFSAWLLVSAVVPAAFSTPAPLALFGAGMAASWAAARRLGRRRSSGYTQAAALRLLGWLLPAALVPGTDVRLLGPALGFGLMAGGVRRALYRRMLGPQPAELGDRRLAVELPTRLAEVAMVAGILGGHVMLLFGVAFLRTATPILFRAFWGIIPALAILGTAVFTIAVRPATTALRAALRAGPTGDPALLQGGLRTARALPRTLAHINFALWLPCTSIGVLYFRRGPGQWSGGDTAMQLGFGALFAWGVSFFQRGWHEDTLSVAVERLRAWTGSEASAGQSLQRGMLREFGVPLLFALALSLFASLGLYRSLSPGAPLGQDLGASAALVASFAILVLAVGAIFLRAARQLSRPLERLGRAADRVAGGQLDAAVGPVEGPAEVALLGESIERMRRALARTIEELRRERAGLESHVERRTAELRRAIEELKSAQAALVHNERMASIGALVAGVAHEIYNPLNAIAGSVAPLERVARELGQMVDAYRAAEPLLPAAALRALRAEREKLDLDGALADLTGIAKVVHSATRRSVEIVAGLKSFSRVSGESVPTDLRAGLRETLGLLAHRMGQAGIRVVERHGDLPLVTCRGGEVNQVLMNLLTNAIQAVGEGERGPGTRERAIEIESSADGGAVTIAVSDSGPGVPEILRERIFDPFVTTRPRGEGTGLGLSISRDIVRRHGGTLSVHAARGEAVAGGARFECMLPIHGPAGGSAPGGGRGEQ
ncbi:MAG: HAMP domain-containing protein [Deltaproteobacteria bacterium]|nr:HAMP domain-containing protein [Deltaproteobacteria bacterium]